MNYPWLDEYILSKKGMIKEFKAEWNTNRYMLKDKMVGLYSVDGEGREVITLKCEPGFGELLRENYDDIRPGYYMNKVHWNSVDLNGSVPDDVLKQMADNSYELILMSHTKKVQKEINDEC